MPVRASYLFRKYRPPTPDLRPPTWSVGVGIGIGIESESPRPDADPEHFHASPGALRRMSGCSENRTIGTNVGIGIEKM